MAKFIPYEKLSKKAKRQQDTSRRGSWGEISPVTRKSPNPKVYDRNAQKRLTSREARQPFCCLIFDTLHPMQLVTPKARFGGLSISASPCAPAQNYPEPGIVIGQRQ